MLNRRDFFKRLISAGVVLGSTSLDLFSKALNCSMAGAESGDLLVDRLAEIPQPFSLLCAEKRVAECHRRLIAEYLVEKKGAEIEHIE